MNIYDGYHLRLIIVVIRVLHFQLLWWQSLIKGNFFTALFVFPYAEDSEVTRTRYTNAFLEGTCIVGTTAEVFRAI